MLFSSCKTHSILRCWTQHLEHVEKSKMTWKILALEAYYALSLAEVNKAGGGGVLGRMVLGAL